MTLPEDPPRLRDDPSESSGELGLGLERMSSNLPSPEALARMGERLGVAPDGTPITGRAPTPSTLAKIAAGVGISGVVLFALLRGSTPEPTAAPPHAPPGIASTTAPVEGPVATAPNALDTPRAPNAPKAGMGTEVPPVLPAESPTTIAEPGVVPVPPSAPPARTSETAAARPSDPPSRDKAPESERAPASRTPRDGRVTTNDVAPAPATPPVAPPPSETALLRDARLALNGDPARALALTEQHRRDYPNGGFSQEREVIAITALGRLGRTSEAKSRADRFRSAHPTSPYIDRVNRAVPP
jgi:hypothetical protein